jgi:hypothetical protein
MLAWGLNLGIDLCPLLHQLPGPCGNRIASALPCSSAYVYVLVSMGAFCV